MILLSTRYGVSVRYWSCQPVRPQTHIKHSAVVQIIDDRNTEETHKKQKTKQLEAYNNLDKTVLLLQHTNSNHDDTTIPMAIN